MKASATATLMAPPPASPAASNTPSSSSSTTPPPPPSPPSQRASFKISSAFSDAVALVKNPAGFMNANRDNDASIRSVLVNYVAVLAAVPFIGTLIGDSWYFRNIGFAFGAAVLTYILDIVAVFVVGYIVWKLAPNFATSTTQVRATRLVAYAFTPAFLIAILDIIPYISAITFLGLVYGLYILYLGMPILMNTPKDRVLTYVIVSVVATIVVYAIIGAIIGAITAAFFIGAFFL